MSNSPCPKYYYYYNTGKNKNKGKSNLGKIYQNLLTFGLASANLNTRLENPNSERKR